MALMTETFGIILLGAGGHARVVAELLTLVGGPDVIGHVSPKPSDDPRLGLYLGSDEALPELVAQGHRFFCGIGGATRAGLLTRLTVCAKVPLGRFETCVHPSAQVAPSAALEPGVFVGALGIVGPDARLGAHALINSAAVVEHDCLIGSNTHCATGARLAGAVEVGESSLVGIGSATLQGRKVGDRAVIGAGAVVLNDVPSGATFVGNPAQAVPGTVA